MAPFIFSTQFIAVPGLQGDQFNGPGTFTWIVRDVTFYVNGPSGSDTHMSIAEEISPSSFNTFVYFTHALSDGPTAYHWEGRQVILPGGTIRAHVDGFPADVRVCGYQLTPT